MAKTELIQLSDLIVNTENYRFEPVGSQKEAIDQMIADQGEKLVNLAEHIMVNGLNPNDRVQVIVSNHDKTQFNVIEGNRRTVTLKLLYNPELIDSFAFTTLKKKFKKLHEEYKSSLITSVECTIYDDPKEADTWVGIKHGYGKTGTGTDEWNPIQKGRFEEKIEGKSSIALQTIKILQNSSDVASDLKENLKDIKLTNLSRLMSDPDVRGFLGLEISSGVLQSQVNHKEVVKGLTQIAKDLLKPNFKVGEIYTKVDRKDYLNKFPASSKPDVTIKAPKPWQFNDVGTSKPGATPSPKPKPKPKERDYLIPKNCLMSINNPKVNAIYIELQKLPLSKFVTVSAVALRVFIENSMDCFIEGNKLTVTKEGKPLSKDSKLMVKIVEVANYLESSGLADSHITKGIRSAANNKNDLLGVETLHAYVHNSKFSPISSHLITTWDNIQPFIEKVWGNIK